MIEGLRADIQRALAAGPSLVLDPIRFAFDGEPFEGRAEVTIDPAKVPPGGITDFDPAAVLGLVDSNADIQLSKALARRFVALAAEMQFRGDSDLPPEQLKYMAEAQAGLMLVQLVSQGFLVDDGEVYRAALRYVDGALTLNDKPLPFGLAVSRYSLLGGGCAAVAVRGGRHVGRFRLHRIRPRTTFLLDLQARDVLRRQRMKIAEPAREAAVEPRAHDAVLEHRDQVDVAQPPAP